MITGAPQIFEAPVGFPVAFEIVIASDKKRYNFILFIFLFFFFSPLLSFFSFLFSLLFQWYGD